MSYSTIARDTLQSQLEHLQEKYVGTGHVETTKHIWAVNQHRDSYSSYIAHTPLLTYFAVAEGLPMSRLKYTFLERMVQPCGPDPEQYEQ